MQARGFIVLGAALAGATIGLAAQAQAAPTGPGSADQAISELEEQGVIVIVEKRSNTPLDRAKVLGVRPGENYQRLAGDVVYLEVG
ncbi:PASTA domain-containing protein [Mycobacterium sp. C31M]